MCLKWKAWFTADFSNTVAIELCTWDTIICWWKVKILPKVEKKKSWKVVEVYVTGWKTVHALCMPAKSLGRLCLRLHNTVDCRPQGRAPLSLGFSRQEYWSGLPCPPPADLPDPGIEPASLTSPALQADSLPLAPPRKPAYTIVRLYDEFWSVALGRLWHRSPPDSVTCNQLWIISSLPLPVLESLEALCWDGATSRSWKNPWSIAGKWAALESISTCRGFVRRDNKFFV